MAEQGDLHHIYVLEKSPSNKTKCFSCLNIIEKDEPRLKIRAGSFHNIVQYRYRCKKCIRKELEKEIESISNIIQLFESGNYE